LEIKKGQIIKGPKWPEPVEVKSIEPFGDLINLIVVTSGGQYSNQLLTKDDLKDITILTQDRLFLSPSWKVFLALEGIRFRFASEYDPLLAMNISKVDPLPHQIEAVYGYVLKQPNIRFLIADDPGAGKTIMAGLILKELKLRNLVKRLLIVVPGHLKDQWRRELKERFNEKCIMIDRSIMSASYGENVWDRENQIITSIDFLKQEDIIPSLSSTHFDLIIVDEAHKMSAYQYGDKTSKTKRYRLGEILSQVTEHMLFLTATPHKGDPENFRLFLDLLKPGFFATSEMVLDSIKNKENPLFIRRVKEDLKDFEGKPLFLPRNVTTIKFDFGTDSPNEKNLYNNLSRYVNSQYNRAIQKDKKRNVAFALIILQRRFASSTYALLRSLERRKNRLTKLLNEVNKPFNSYKEKGFDFEEIEDLTEEERWEKESLFETISVAENLEELKKEITTLDGLINDAREIIRNEEEIKIERLKEAILELNKEFPNEKIIIFTEAKDTLYYLENKIKSWGYNVNTIHGGMSLEERIKQESVFKNQTQILVATEAAGEGINLQFCHLMINYDIPWNPNRLEQRMGRIHRYGQTKEVFIFNFVAIDTREGKILNRLFEKLEEIKNALGSEKVFDVLGELFEGKNLTQLMIEAAANARDINDILNEIDIVVDQEYINKVKDHLGESLATRYIDYTRIKEISKKAKEYRLIPEYTENFFKKAFVKADGKIKQRKDNFLEISFIPFDIRRIADDDNFKRKYGTLLKSYPKITFDKEVAFNNPDAEFISFGHPLFEVVLLWVEKSFKESLIKGSTFLDPDGRLNGYIIFFEGEIKDGKGLIAGRRLFAFYIEDDKISHISPTILWDLEEVEAPKGESINIEELRSKVTNSAIESLNKYMKILQKERAKEAEIKRKYGIASLEYLIRKLDFDLIALDDRKSKGDNVDIVIRRKEERKRSYEKALLELRRSIEQERELTLSVPKYLAIIKVIPDRSKIGMKSDEQIEKIGMEIAMKYERMKDRIPEDVSKESLGFDIRSTDKKGNIRYIEVKARAEIGEVALTKNEWFKAQRFKDDYYLYVVMNAISKPKLYIIRNPAKRLKPQERIEVVRFIITPEMLNGVVTR